MKSRVLALVAFVALVCAGGALVPATSRAAPDQEACRKQLEQCNKKCVHAGGSDQREEKQLQCLEECAKSYHQCMSG